MVWILFLVDLERFWSLAYIPFEGIKLHVVLFQKTIFVG